MPRVTIAEGIIEGFDTDKRDLTALAGFPLIRSEVKIELSDVGYLVDDQEATIGDVLRDRRRVRLVLELVDD